MTFFMKVQKHKLLEGAIALFISLVKYKIGRKMCPLVGNFQ
uniref:Uncharacterized protein n=1 Tax=Arundo donax TaxID=35708 RepID=A0A0A9BGT1_ARUDO